MEHDIRIRPCALIFRGESILLVEYNDENGPYYNLPGGGLEYHETIKEAVKRELLEEASVEIEVGPIAYVYEYQPHKDRGAYGGKRTVINIIFDCDIREGAEPVMPMDHDHNQTGVKWINLEELDRITLFPNIKEQIKQYYVERQNTTLIEDWTLPLG
jgi:ADP-ribose pyrophosphatase YjhB (NUDIX family)